MPRWARTSLRRGIDALLLLAGALAGVVAFAYLAPLPAESSAAPPVGTVVLASDGTILWRDTATGIRIPVTLDAVSPAVIDATIATEDQRFRQHPGVDPLAVARAILHFPRERSGASTITQQLARSLYLGGTALPLPLRKAREAVYALQLDARLGKDAILERYLNEAYYGRGAYGIEAAARVYFGVSAANLDIARAAYLAGLPQQPWIGDLGGEEALRRQHHVLDRMLATGRLTPIEHASALAVEITPLDEPTPPIAPHFVRFALDELQRAAPDLRHRPGLIIETTLHPLLQAGAEQQALLQLERLQDSRANNAAVLVLDPRDGRILAMAGNVTPSGLGADYNFAVEPRQPGSALKPFLYGLALQHGYTAASPLLDVPTTLPVRDGVYTPMNYDESYRGVVTLRTALASSLNVPAVRVADQLGVDSFLRELHRYGLSTLTAFDQYDLALALGAGEVRMVDLAAAYGVLATNGVHREPFAIARVRDARGNILYERPSMPGRQVISPEVAFLLTDILADPHGRIAGFGPGSVLELPFPAAVKTGTTTEFRDNWTVGYTPRQVVAVWVGNADNRAMRNVSGISGAAPIWAEVMKLARNVQGPEPFTPPPGLVRAAVCHPTGLLPGPNCPIVADEWFLPGTTPADTESYYVRDVSGQLAIDPPPLARPWLAHGRYPLAAPASPGDTLAIVQPADGAVLFIAPELQRQELIVRVSCPTSVSRLVVRNGSDLLATADGCPGRIVATLATGTHNLRVEAVLDDGRVLHASSRYEVRSR
ncbi:MAG: hypothetical protein Kow0010_18850 [Dehalococcoidia bacterium]